MRVHKTSCKETFWLLIVAFCWAFLHSSPQMVTMARWIIFLIGISPWNSQPFSWISESLRLTFHSCYMIIGIQFLFGLKHLFFLLSAHILLLMPLKSFLSFLGSMNNTFISFKNSSLFLTKIFEYRIAQVLTVLVLSESAHIQNCF